MNFTRREILIAFAFLALRGSSLAYGPLGHEIVGAIADERLANSPTAAKVRVLLNGLTLEKAAVIADEIKGWDKKGVDDPRSFHFSAYCKIDRQLRDFWRANQPTHEMNSVAPSHHWFHYTDVPVVPAQAYHEGTAGRSKWDIVHMIPYCVQVLKGQIPEQNERKITKPVALILLAHYVADIHQPLHVGAEYFDQQGQIADPDKNKSALEDEGGNTFTLELSDEPPRRRGFHKRSERAFPSSDRSAAEKRIADADRATKERACPRNGDTRIEELADAIKRRHRQLCRDMGGRNPADRARGACASGIPERKTVTGYRSVCCRR